MPLLVVIFSFFFGLSLGAKERICLNMIVKNESHVIRRCLDSVKPLIDYWVIVDTGSTDGTQTVIREHMKSIPGELIERPWKNFGYNRTEALELAKNKGDFLLIIDADDWLEYPPSFKFPELKSDLYNMWRGTSNFQYLIPQLIRAALPWRWVGVLHEYLDCKQGYTSSTLEHIKYVSGCDGARSHDPEKYLKHVKLLEDGLLEEPNNERYMFYLGESYRDAGEAAKAIVAYQKRVACGGWDEEVFWSMLQIGLAFKQLNVADDMIVMQLYNAHRFRPHRVEPVYYLAEFYTQRQNYAMAYETIKSREVAFPSKQKDVLFNEVWMEEYGLLFQLSICSYYLGNYKESLEACNLLLANKHLSESWRKQVESNRLFALEKLAHN